MVDRPGNRAGARRRGAGELADDPVAALEILDHWLEKDAVLLAERAESMCRLGGSGAQPGICLEASCPCEAETDRATWPSWSGVERKEEKEHPMIGHERITQLAEKFRDAIKR
jgi:hypothetical protein